MRIIYINTLFLLVWILSAYSVHGQNNWPQESLGGDEKLFFNESDFIRMRSNIDENEWAAELYKKLKTSVLASKTYYPHSGPKEWTDSFIVRETAIYYRISGDETVLPFIKKMLIQTYDLNQLEKPLFKKGGSLTGFWSWGMFKMGNIAAWDLVKNLKEFKDIQPAMNQRLDEIIAQGFAYYSDITRLGNTQFWGITTLGIVGYLQENKKAIDLAINGPHGFKASILRYRDATFWPEPLKYDYGYVASAMHMLAEATQLNHGENLYKYTAKNGASFKGMMDGLVSLMLTDGALPICGDGSSYVAVREGNMYPHGKYFFKKEQDVDRTNIKIELLYSIYKDPVYGWLAAQNSNRDGWDNNFWGWTGLTHGIPITETKVPSANSMAYHEFGTALLRADTSSNYWGSDAISAYIRNGASLQFHSHNDHFALGVIAYKKQLYYDNNIDWDYLAPRKSRNYRNATPFSNRMIAHNSVVVDFREPDRNVIKLEKKTPEKPGVDFSEIVTSGPMQILNTSGSIYKGVKQKRTVGITEDYVLDIFECSADEKHNYDYTLHSFGTLSFDSNLKFKSYSHLNQEYGLGKMDRASKKENNHWFVDTKHATTNSSLKAVFQDTDAIGSLVLLANAKNTEVLAAKVPYYISGNGWGEILPATMPERKPMLIVRRNEKTTRFVVLHVPFIKEIPTYQIKVKGAKIIIEGPEYTDEYSIKKQELVRREKNNN